MRRPSSLVLGVPVCTAFPYMPTPRFRRIGGINWHSSSATPPEGRYRLSALQRIPNGDSVYTFTHPWSDGTTGIRLSPVELLEKLAALVPLPHVHLVRYAGCLAPHSHLREAIRPTPRQQGVDGEQAHVGTHLCILGSIPGGGSLAWSWPPVPGCRWGALRLMAVITQESVITRILRHLQLAPVPPPIAPARTRQETYVFADAHAVTWRLRGDVRAAQVSLPLCVYQCRAPSLRRPPRAPLPRLAPAHAVPYRALPCSGLLQGAAPKGL